MEVPPEFKEEEKPETSVWSILTKEAFISAIEEVIKIEPLTSKDTATYRFKFNFNGEKGTIEINVSDFMRSYKKFEELLFSHFDITLPSKLKAKPADFQPSEWTKFVQLCGKMCTKVPPTESTTWAETDRFMDTVAGFQILEYDRKDEWGANSGADNILLRKVSGGITQCALKNKDVAKLFKTLEIVITREEMGSHMKKRGIKRDVDGAVRVGKKVIGVWWFTEESLIEHGMGAEESTIPIMRGGLYENL